MADETIADLVRLDQGLVSRKIFVDEGIYRRELEKVFGKCWLFLAHESQLPKQGDYVTNYMGEDPVIVCRGDDGKVRVFLNSCRHRGMKVCRTDSGNTSEFQCSFHGWTYANTGTLLGVPFFREAYGGKLAKEKLGLREVPRVAIYGGLIFGCWDESATGLEEYLGDLRWYLDVFLERHLGGIEFISGQQRYQLAANWKIAGENFVGDNYHLYHSHGSMYELDIVSINPINSVKHRKGQVFHNVSFDHGHGLSQLEITGKRYEIDRGLAVEMGPEVVEYVDECHNRLLKQLSRSQASVHALSFGNLFPNFSMNDFSALRPTGLYLWHPRGPAKLESWQWTAVDAHAPQAVKDLCRIEFTRTQSITGIAAQDDTENFEQVTEAASGFFGQKLDFNYQMSLDGGPGEANVDFLADLLPTFPRRTSAISMGSGAVSWNDMGKSNTGQPDVAAAIGLQHEVEQFLYAEARLLSERRYGEWLDLFTDDVRYRMPVRENRSDGSGIARENELAIFDDDKAFLTARVARLNSPLAHAERPPSRTRYFITNVEITPAGGATELLVACNLLVHQSRLEKTECFYVGSRTDVLRRVDGQWRICRRDIVLDHVLLPRTLSIFF